MLITFWQADNWRTQKIITGDLNARKVFLYSVQNNSFQIFLNTLTSRITSIQKLINAFVLTKGQIFVIPAWGNGQIVYLADLQGKNSLQNLILALDATQQTSSALLTDDTQRLVNGFITVEVFQGIFLAILHDQDQRALNTLIVNESKSLVNCLVISGSHAKLIPIPFEIYQLLLTELKDRLVTTQILLSAIAHAGLKEMQSLATTLQQEQNQTLVAEIIQGLLQTQQVELGIDSYQGAVQKLINALVRWGLIDTQALVGAIDAGSHIVTQQISILLDTQDITNKVLSGSINLFGKGISDFSLDLKTDTILTGNEVKIIIGTKSYSFLLEEESYNAKGKTLSLWGRAKSASLYEPLAARKDYKFKNRMASHIAQEVCQGFTLEWQIDDWLIPFYEKNAYPLDVVKELAQAVGAVVRAMPDGIIYVVYPYFDEYPELNLELPLTLSKERKIKEADGVRVVYGEDKSFVALEADKTEVRTGEWAKVKVYCLTDYRMHCTADTYYKAESGVVEEVEEDIIIEQGNDTYLSKPVLEVVSVSTDRVGVAGRRVYCKDDDCDCLLVSIKYKTQYDLWRLTNHTESKALFCAVETENSYTVLEGTGERIEEVEEPLINDSYLARRRAEKELTEKKGLKHLKVTIPFEEMTCNPVGLCVSTPYGRGVVIGNTISFTAKPLKVVNQLEVLLWPQ